MYFLLIVVNKIIKYLLNKFAFIPLIVIIFTLCFAPEDNDS